MVTRDLRIGATAGLAVAAIITAGLSAWIVSAICAALFGVIVLSYLGVV